MHGLGPGIAGVIDPALDNHFGPGKPQLLLARAIELDDTIDRRYLLKQQCIVGPPLVQGGGACPRCPADLAFDLRHRLLDPTRRRLGFLGLRLCKQLRCLPVGEPRLEAAIHGKHEHDHFDEGGNVFAKEASGPEPVVARCLRRHSKFSEFGCRSWTERHALARFLPHRRPRTVANRSANDWLKQRGKILSSALHEGVK